VSVTEHTGVIILAAGSSSRLGRPKQLVEFKGKSLLQKMIDLCGPFALGSKVIVLGAHADAIRKAVDPGSFSYVINEHWEGGMGGSIRKGVEQTLELNPETGHLLFLLSDQPFVTAALLQQLLEKHGRGPQEMTASFYDEDIGVPALFSKTMFPSLLKLKGDEGAKKLMKQNEEKVAAVPFEKGTFDVDTHEDYMKLRQFES